MKKKQTLLKVAMELIKDPKFLFNIGQQIGVAGVIGENRNRLVLFLACLTSAQEKPVSILVKGPTGSGKNNLVKAGLSVVPKEVLITRSSFSDKALAHGDTKLTQKIVYIAEHRAGKHAEFFRRLLQSEGELHHEATVVAGAMRGTEVASRVGAPVFLSTTTDDKVYPDDETRFLSLRADESSEQTREVVRAQFSGESQKEPVQLAAWHEVFRVLCKKIPIIRHPSWFGYLAERIPASEPRARRDVPRFLSLLKAVTLCRSYADGRRAKAEEIEITFADYCVAFQILADSFSSTFSAAHPLSLQVAAHVRELHSNFKRPIIVEELVKAMGWKKQLVYKWLADAVKHNLVTLSAGTHANNRKMYVPSELRPTSFLPEPQTLLDECAELDAVVHYEDPLTGDTCTLRRKLRKEGRKNCHQKSKLA